MANMAYCRFENTYKDLLDCQEALQDVGSIENYEEGTNEREKRYVRKLVNLCKEIAEEFQEDEE